MAKSILRALGVGEITKSALSVLGIKAYSLKNIPWGISLERDLQRIFHGQDAITIIDVGANVGQTAVRFKKAFRGSRIWCFEPISKTYGILCENTREYEQIQCIASAVGEKNGSVIMEMGGNSEESRVVHSVGVKTGNHVEVPMTTIDTFITSEKIETVHLLKTDCEGFDLNAIKGASSSLDSGKISALLCEVTLNDRSFHSKFSQLNEYLVSKGYYFFAFYDYNGWGAFHSDGQFHNALWLRRR
jgi:FkbM family methyltransferase